MIVQPEIGVDTVMGFFAGTMASVLWIILFMVVTTHGRAKRYRSLRTG